MNFKKATDELLASVTLKDLAEALGVSVQAIRQARVGEKTTAYRMPPPGWEVAAARLAIARSRAFGLLAKRLASKRG